MPFISAEVYQPPNPRDVVDDVQTQIPINHLRQGPFDTRPIHSTIDFVCALFRKINYYLPRIRTGPDRGGQKQTECMS